MTLVFTQMSELGVRRSGWETRKLMLSINFPLLRDFVVLLSSTHLLLPTP